MPQSLRPTAVWTGNHGRPGTYTLAVQNRVVARYLDGRTLKGQTADFLPTRPNFHVIPSGQAGTSIQVVDVKIADLKAVFFVKDLVGDAAYNESRAFTPDVRAR